MNNFVSMDDSGMNRTRRKLFILASTGLFLDGYDLSIITMAILVLPTQLHFGKLDYILVDVSSFVGMLIGAPVLGLLSDRIGRKKIFGLDLIFFVFFAITAGLSTNFIELFLSRLLMGFGIGGDYPISSTMMSEFSPRKSRGKLLITMVGMYWVGAFFSAVANYFLVAYSDFWRYTFIIGGLLAIPIVLLRFSVPESPRWLAKHGKINEAIKSEDEIVGTHDEINNVIEKKPKTKYGSTFIFVIIAWFIFDVAAYGIGFFYPTIFSTLGFKDKFKSIAEASMVISIGGILGYVIAFPLADKIGRRFLIIFGFSTMSLLLVIGSFIHITGIYTVPYFFIFVLFEQWVGAVTLFYPTELFDTSVRSTVQGIATAISRVGAIIGIIIFPLFPIFHSLSIFAAFAIIGLIMSIIYAPETNRNSLEKNVEKYTMELDKN